tara:strand:+ start:29 stop:958 length:930 start_codon:yes stop_codon:yes gene_type:complete
MQPETMQNKPDAVIRAEGLTKVFKDFWGRPKVHALDAVDFEVRPGEIFGLLGPNGAGKSTAIKLMLGLLYPTRGKLDVLGNSPRDVRTKERIGYLPEESHLYDYLTARETLTFYARLFDMDNETARTRIDDLLQRAELEETGQRVVGEFSKGMRRRVGLAQALVNNPDLLILDEPTSGLDPIGCRQVKDLLTELARQGKTILLCSHLLADVEDICDRIAILYGGRIYAYGSMQGLLQQVHYSRVTFPELAPPAMSKVLAQIREACGQEPEVDRPAQSLEQYFVDIVKQAQSATDRLPPAVGADDDAGTS